MAEKNKVTKEDLDSLILNMVHDLMFGEFSREDDGRNRLLNIWYSEYKHRVHETVDSICGDNKDSKSDKKEKEESSE
mgnify:CR=1 FL=1